MKPNLQFSLRPLLVAMVTVACASMFMPVESLGQLTTNYVALTNPTNAASKSGWNLQLNDNFNAGLSPFWKWRYVWGNHHPNGPSYNIPANRVVNSQYLRLRAARETYTGQDYSIPLPYTAGMINSDPGQDTTGEYHHPANGHLYKYGHFEARIKNPGSRLMWPAFWLFGEQSSEAPFSYYNEIDIFEFGVSDQILLTHHWAASPGAGQSSGSPHRAMPGSKFGNTWVTYGVRWEPNKIIWYIDNQAVRIISSSEALIPNVSMRIKVNTGADDENAFYDYHLPELFPNYMDIDYLRVFQRPNVQVAYPIFSVNGSSGPVINSPATIPYSTTSPFFLNASESYMPNHQYSITIQRMDANNNLVGPIASTTQVLSLTQANSYDLRALCNSQSVPLLTGSKYRISISGGVAATYAIQHQYFMLIACAPSIAFRINGVQNNTAVQLIPYNYMKNRIILNASQTTTCSGDIFFAIQECDSKGAGFGPELSNWFIGPAGQNTLREFDVEAFCITNSFPVKYNSHYRIKIATGPIWTEFVQLIKIQDLQNSINFRINGASPAFPAAVTIYPDAQILVDASDSRFRTNKYWLGIAECTSSGTLIGAELSLLKDYKRHDFPYPSDYDIGKIDIRSFAHEMNLSLTCGKYYRIRIATEAPVAQQLRSIFIAPCSSVDGTFRIKHASDDIGSTLPEHYFATAVDANIFLYAPASSSCTRDYFLAVQKMENGILVGTEASSWLSQQDVYQAKVTGMLDVKKFCSDRILPLQENSRYQVKFVPSNGGCYPNGWQEWFTQLVFGSGIWDPGSRTVFVSNDPGCIDVPIEIVVRDSRIFINSPEQSLTGEVTGATGQLIRSGSITPGGHFFSGTLPAGVYVVRIICSTGSFVRKVSVVD